jgi:hypothetical protein
LDLIGSFMEVEKAVERKQAIVRPGSELATALIEAQRQGIAMAAAKTNKEDQQTAVRAFGDGAVEYVLPDGTVLATDDFQDGRRGVDLEKLAAKNFRKRTWRAFRLGIRSGR